MLSLGCIVISDLVTDLFKHSLPGMIVLYLARPFFTLKVFLHEIVHTHIRTYIATYCFLAKNQTLSLQIHKMMVMMMITLALS